MDIVKYRLNETTDVTALVVGERTLEGEKHATLVFANPSRGLQMTSSFWREALVCVKDARQGTGVGGWVEQILVKYWPVARFGAGDSSLRGGDHSTGDKGTNLRPCRRIGTARG